VVVEQLSAAQAVEILIQEYGKLVFHVIYSLTGEWEESQDLTQDTFISALRAIDEARSARGEDFHARAWLLRIAVNMARMHLRRRRLIHFSPLSNLEPEEHADNGGWQNAIVPVQPAGYATQETGDPAEQVSERDAVARALGKLPESFRVPLLLSTVAGFSHAEITTMLKLNEVALRQRLSRARRTFQQLYLAESREVVGQVRGKRRQGEQRQRSRQVKSGQTQQRVKQALAFQGSVAEGRRRITPTPLVSMS
jgi:RNA polymerase sigma factor (sigma-70 family)